ncbi:MAG: hypothetical protein ACK42Y_09700 [Candidatus Thermochlorobacter sp.]
MNEIVVVFLGAKITQNAAFVKGAKKQSVDCATVENEIDIHQAVTHDGNGKSQRRDGEASNITFRAKSIML